MLLRSQTWPLKKKKTSVSIVSMFIQPIAPYVTSLVLCFF